MTTTSSSPTMHRSDPRAALDLVEVKPGKKFSRAVLQDFLPTVKDVLFFGKLYELSAQQLGALLHVVLNTPLTAALFNEGHAHSQDLQDYVVDVGRQINYAELGDISFDPDVPKGEILPEMWEELEVEVAASIKAVAEKLGNTIGLLPGKQGAMMFQSMRVMNAKRPVLGDYKARIHHAPQKQNLVILDVSGSMTEATVRKIVDDVVALSYKANAHIATVSNQCHYWEPGTYGTDDVLRSAAFGGTHYEQLAPLFQVDWGTVITIADYDSSLSAKSRLAACTGKVDQLLDLSLVGRPTFLAECVGQLASEIRPLLIGNSNYVLT